MICVIVLALQQITQCHSLLPTSSVRLVQLLADWLPRCKVYHVIVAFAAIIAKAFIFALSNAPSLQLLMSILQQLTE